MSLDDLGNVGEAIGALGVITSLIYLAIQIRKNDVSTRASTTQSLLSTSTDMLLQRVYSGFEFENATEFQKKTLLFAIFSHMNSAHYQRRVGTLDDEAWSMFDGRLRRLVRTSEDFDSWWEEYRINFTEPFVEYVDSIRGT